MQKEGIIKCRPCSGTFILYSALLLWMSLIWFLGYQEFENPGDIIGWMCVHIFWFLTGMTLILLSIYKWDVPIYIGDEGILQKRKKEMVFFRYDEIQDVKLVRFYWDRFHGYALKVFMEDDIIRIKVGKGLKCYDAFMRHCTNAEVITSIYKQMDDRGLCRNR